MFRRIGSMLSISLFWLVLSVFSDGMNALLLPARLAGAGETRAGTLGLLSFAGLLAGMLIQPAAGAWSDRLRARWGRKGVLAVGTGLTLGALVLFGFTPALAGIAAGYLLAQVGASITQAAQQGFIPDRVPQQDRGLASGIKNFMDIGGAMLGFVILGQVLGEGKPALASLIMGALLLAALALTAVLVREKPLDSAPARQDRLTLSSVFRFSPRRHPQFAWLVVSRFFFLLGTYAVGRFLLLFVADRLGLDPDRAAEEAGNLLAALALVTVIAAPLAGWAADRTGRIPMMAFGSLVSALGVLGYIFAVSAGQIFWFGCLLSLGSAAFAGANWAMTADVVPKEEPARFFGLANFGTAGAAAAAGLFGPLVDVFNQTGPGAGFNALFIAAALSFAVSAASLAGLVQARRNQSSPAAASSVLPVEGDPGVFTNIVPQDKGVSSE